MLDLALSNRLVPSGSSSSSVFLLVLSDTLLQPALPLTRQFISSALSASSPSSRKPQGAKQGAQHVVVIGVQHPPEKYFPPKGRYDPKRVTLLDCSSPSSEVYPPVQSTSAAPSSTLHTIDLSSPTGAAELEQRTREAIEGVEEGGAVLVVVDSANALAEELEGGVGAVSRWARKTLGALKGRRGSRLLIVHNADLPPPPPSFTSPSSSSFIQPSVLQTLLSPSLSPSLLHLTLHPSSHLEVLARDYGLAVPLPSSSSCSQDDDEEEGEGVDPRMAQFLGSLAGRAYGDPFVRPRKAGEEDERIALSSLCLPSSSSSSSSRPSLSSSASSATQSTRGSCILSFAARNLSPLPLSPPSARDKAEEREKERERQLRGEVKKAVRWGFCGVRAVREGEEGGGVRYAEERVGRVLDGGRCGRRAKLSSPLASPAATAPSTSTSTSTSHSNSSSSAPAPPPLTFSLSLTPSQLAARASSAHNPFLGRALPIYGEEGYVAPTLPGLSAAAQGERAGGGRVEYTPDGGDDWDDEDPDEDLEI